MATQDHSELEKSRASNKVYYATPRGRAVHIWEAIKRRCRERASYAHVEIRMTREEFIAWAVPLYEAWNRLGVPSVDRIQNDGHYEISNMQMIPATENSLKDRVNFVAPFGMSWCRDCGKYLDKSMFHRDLTQWDGVRTYCKDHWNLRVRQKYQRDKAQAGSPTDGCSACPFGSGLRLATARRRWRGPR